MERPSDIELPEGEIGARVRFLRKNFLGIRSQEVFGTAIGVSRGAVANWELGKGISLDHLYRIAETYDISVAWLFAGSGQPRSKGNAQELSDLIANSGLSEADQQELVDDITAMLDIRIKHRGIAP